MFTGGLGSSPSMGEHMFRGGLGNSPVWENTCLGVDRAVLLENTCLRAG